jgi:hypothetical protein
MSYNEVTMVTCFFDINRKEKGDGRTIDEYKEWIKRTLQLNCNLYIITELKFYDFFIEFRPKHYNTYIKVIEFKDLHYNKYYDRIKNIIESDYYKNKIAYPNRVECKLPEYNIIQYSKFHCLQMAIDENIFKSNYFFWMDAGVSRFFLDVDISKSYPSNNCIELLNNEDNKDKFFIQNRPDLNNYIIDEDFIWKADNMLSGGIFGGSIKIVQEISKLVEDTFVNKMLNNNNANNEQLTLAIVWKENSHLFHLFNNTYNYHLIIFKLLSL